VGQLLRQELLTLRVGDADQLGDRSKIGRAHAFVADTGYG
jgi:hypothetical protein